MKTYKVKAELNHSMIADLQKMHGLDTSIEEVLVKQVATVLPRKIKIKKITQKLNNKDS